MDQKTAARGVVAAGGCVALGAPLAWITVSQGIFSVTLLGTQGDGKITLAVGVVMALIGFSLISNPASGARIAAIVCGIGITAVGAYDYLNATNKASGTSVTVSPGVGLILTVGGGALGVACAVAARSRASAPPAPAGSPLPPPLPPMPPAPRIDPTS